MSMENHGKIWQFDHCLPVSTFNLLDEEPKEGMFNWLDYT